MTVPTQPVTIKLADFGGPSVPGVVVKARMSEVDYTTDGVFVSTELVSGTTDVNGQAILQLFPNAVSPTGLGTRGTTIRVTAAIPGSKSLDVQARIPNTPCNLVDALVPDEDVPLTEAQLTLLAIQNSESLAANWAALVGTPVSGGLYSAREYAQGNTAGVGGSAKDWASKTGTAVSGGEFSAKYHAQAAAQSATNAEASRDAIDDRIYPGAYSSPPTAKPSGAPIAEADIYFTDAGTPMVYRSGAWGVLIAADSVALAASSGSALVGHRRTSVQKALDQLGQETAGRGGLHSFWRQLRAAMNGTARVTVFGFGDSIRGYPWVGLGPLLTATIGQAGVALDTITSGVGGYTVSTTGDAFHIDGATHAFDYTYWPTGIHDDVGVGGTVLYAVGGANFTGTDFAVYYAKRPGGGTMRVELLDASNVVQSTADIDTSNATVDYGKHQFTIAAAARKIRVTGLTGRCVCVGAKFVHSGIFGVIYSGIGRGGLGLPDINTAAPAIWKGCVADLQPQLATYSMAEGAGDVSSHLPTFLNNYRAAYAGTDWVLCGLWPYGTSAGVGDFGQPLTSQFSYIQQMETKAVADSYGYRFFDSYAIFGAGGVIQKEVPADVHLSTNDTYTYAGQFMQQLGLFLQPIGRSYTDKGYATTHYQAPLLNIAGGAVWEQLAGKLRASGLRDLIIDFDRNLTVNGNFLGVPVQLMQFSGTAATPGVMWRSFYSTTTMRNVANYAGDGDFSVLTDAGGNLVFRARVGGVLKQCNFWLGDPGVDGASNIDNSKGIGSRLKLYGATNTGFTTAGEYAATEFKFAHDTNSLDLVCKLAPAGGGALQTVTLPTNGRTPRDAATVSPVALTGAVNFDVGTSPVEFRTSVTAADWSVNFRWSSTVTLDSVMSAGQTLVVRHFATQGAAAFKPTAWTIDGNAVTPKWLGGSAPAAGNANSVDSYVYRIVKTAAATFTVFAAQERYA